MPKVRERNEEATVLMKDDLESFDAEFSRANATYDSLCAHGIDGLCLVFFHNYQYAPKFSRFYLYALSNSAFFMIVAVGNGKLALILVISDRSFLSSVRN